MASTITVNESRSSHYSVWRSNRTSRWNVHDGEAAFAKIKTLQEQEGLRAKRNPAESKSQWRKIVSCLDVVAASLCVMAEDVPIVKPAVKAFKVLIQMEQSRPDNCPQIVNQCYSIARTLDLFKHFKDGLPDQEVDLELRSWLSDIERLIEEFANFSKFYYAECNHALPRIWNAMNIRTKLDDFNRRFEDLGGRIHAILAANDLFVSTDTKFSEVSARIRAQFGEPLNEKEAGASLFIEKWSRDVILKDREKLNELAMILNEKMTESVLEGLRLDIDERLKSRMESFHRKFESSMANVDEDIVRWRDSTLIRPDAGQHELLSDPDIKEVWKMNVSFRSARFNGRLNVPVEVEIECQSAKFCSRSVQLPDFGRRLTLKSDPIRSISFLPNLWHHICSKELSNYFEEKFWITQQSGVPRTDSWTLLILSRVMHHSAIGDAIDEGGSGFISIHEVETFSRRRPTGITLPEWLVYWAVGWKLNNAKCNNSILASLDIIGDKCRKAARTSRPEDIRPAARQYLGHIETLRNIALWVDPTDSEEEELLLGSDGIELQSLLKLVEDLNTNESRKRWEEVQWKMEEPSDMASVFHGSETRIEQKFLCVTQVLLENHQERIMNSTNLTDGDWSEMAETLKALVQGFRDRVRSLVHGWRAQKLDVERQITSFSGGICAGWYAMYGQSHRDARKNVSFVDMSTGSTPMARTFSLPVQTMSGQINELGDRVGRLERLINEKMDNLQSNMVSMLQDVLISEIMLERGMTTPSSASVAPQLASLANHPNRGSKPVINVEIPSVTFNDVVVNQNGSLHMNTPNRTLRDDQRRASGETFSANSHQNSSSLARAETLTMSSFVQTASGRRYFGGYDEGTEASSAYTPSTVETTDIIHSEVSDAVSDVIDSGLSDAQSGTGPFGLGTPMSMTFQPHQGQYYGGVMLISRPDPAPHLRISPLDQDTRSEGTTAPRFSPPFHSAQSDAFMDRFGYDVPVSAIPGTDTESSRSKGSKQSAASSNSGFRGGLKSVKDSIRGIGIGPTAGNRIRKKSGSNVSTPRTPRQQPGALDIGTSNNEWHHMNNSGASSNGTISPPRSSTSDRFNRIGHSPSASPPPPGLARLASPFSYAKQPGSQPRIGTPIPHDPTLGHGGMASALTTRPSVSSTRTFGQPAGGSSSNVGLALAQPLLGRSGHVSGLRSLDVAPPSRGMARWPNARPRSKSIDGL